MRIKQQIKGAILFQNLFCSCLNQLIYFSNITALKFYIYEPNFMAGKKSFRKLIFLFFCGKVEVFFCNTLTVT